MDKPTKRSKTKQAEDKLSAGSRAFYRHFNSPQDGYGTACVILGSRDSNPPYTRIGTSLVGPLDRDRFNRGLGRTIAKGRALKGVYTIIRRLGPATFESTCGFALYTAGTQQYGTMFENYRRVNASAHHFMLELLEKEASLRTGAQV